MAFSPQILVQGLIALATGLVYTYVGRLVVAREVSLDARLANYAFAMWWWAFGAVDFLAGCYSLPAAMGYRDLALVVTVLNVLLALVAVAIGALLYYLVYLYTGSQRAFWPIVAAYTGFALALIYLVAWMQPTGFDPASQTGALVYTRQLEGAPAIILGLVFSLPILVAAAAYGSLYFRTSATLPRYRIGVVAGSFILWFGWSTLSTVMQLAKRYPEAWWLVAANGAVALLGPLLVVIAYRPPAWVRRWLGMADRSG